MSASINSNTNSNKGVKVGSTLPAAQAGESSHQEKEKEMKMKVLIFETGVASEIARDILIAFLKHWEVPFDYITSEDYRKLEELGVTERDLEGYYVLRSKNSGDITDFTSDYAYVLIQDEAKILCGVKVYTKSERCRKVFEFIYEKFTKIMEVLE